MVNQDKDWERVNLMAEVAIERDTPPPPRLVLQLRDEQNAPKKRTCLKPMYLLPFGSARISKMVRTLNCNCTKRRLREKDRCTELEAIEAFRESERQQARPLR